MKLTGELKKKVEASESIEEVRQAFSDAGLELSDEELETVGGGKMVIDYRDYLIGTPYDKRRTTKRN